MSKQQHLKVLAEEIRQINRTIDRKILLNRSYRKEALRHKALLKQLRKEEASLKGFASPFRFLFSKV